MSKIHTTSTSGIKARKKLKKGAFEVFKHVSKTLGPRGRNIVIHKQHLTEVLQDGVRVANEIHPQDPYENAGAAIIKQAARQQVGKVGDGCQPYSSKILTPKGWTTMGDIKPGDIICGTNKTSQKVVEVFEKGVREIVKIRFNGGREVECSKDHLWTVVDENGNKDTVTTFTLIDLQNDHTFYTPREAVEFEKVDLPIDPYTLGVLISDGCLRDTGSIEISLGVSKERLIEKIVVPKGIHKQVRFYPENNYYRVKLSGRDIHNKSMRDYLRDLGLYNTNSHTKFIPKKYLHASYQDRIKLFKGLMDTDAWRGPRGNYEHSTVSESLHKDVVDLFRSLGKAYTTRKKERSTENGSYSNNPVYVIKENLANRYANKYGHKIVEIIETGRSEPVRCIKVSNPDHLYITDDYIVTHNTTVSTILSYSILDESLKMVESGIDPTIIKPGLERGRDLLVDEIKRISKKIKTKQEHVDIATISSKDKHMGKIIGEKLSEIGTDGVITVEENKGFETFIDHQEGMQINMGYIHPYFVTNNRSQTATVNGANILVTDHKLNNIYELAPMMENVVNQNRKNNLLIICGDCTGDVLGTFVTNKLEGKLNVNVVKAPSYNSDNILQDIAVLVGANFISEKARMDLKNVTIDDLGYAKTVTSTKDATVIVGGAGQKENVDARIESIKGEMKDADGEFALEKLKERLAKLTSGVFVMYVGGSTEVETREKKERAIDAIEATRAAMREGIVPGGETIYMPILEVLNDPDNEGEEYAFRILRKALIKPFEILVENGGFNSGQMIEKLDGKDFGIGVNVASGNVENLVDNGILDPSEVSQEAIKNAVSVVNALITSEGIIDQVIEDSK